jgi:hypothetical protein
MDAVPQQARFHKVAAITSLAPTHMFSWQQECTFLCEYYYNQDRDSYSSRSSWHEVMLL